MPQDMNNIGSRHYHCYEGSYHHADRHETVGKLLSVFFRIAFGKKIIVLSPNVYKIKAASLIERIFAGIAAIFCFQISLIGIYLIHRSKTHRYTYEVVQKAAQKSNSAMSTKAAKPMEKEKQKVDGLKKIQDLKKPSLIDVKLNLTIDKAKIPQPTPSKASLEAFATFIKDSWLPEKKEKQSEILKKSIVIHPPLKVKNILVKNEALRLSTGTSTQTNKYGSSIAHLILNASDAFQNRFEQINIEREEKANQANAKLEGSDNWEEEVEEKASEEVSKASEELSKASEELSNEIYKNRDARFWSLIEKHQQGRLETEERLERSDNWNSEDERKMSAEFYKKMRKEFWEERFLVIIKKFEKQEIFKEKLERSDNGDNAKSIVSFTPVSMTNKQNEEVKAESLQEIMKKRRRSMGIEDKYM